MPSRFHLYLAGGRHPWEDKRNEGVKSGKQSPAPLLLREVGRPFRGAIDLPPAAAVTNYCKLGALPQELIASQFRRSEV